jgi:hypothetical protein
MLSLRNRFGIPGVISVIALVFAMLGGAYAASNNGGGKAIASAKAKKGPRGPKGATGPAGPAGPVGSQGAAGANGKDGANGSNGSNGAPGAPGAAGKTVLSGSGDPNGAVSGNAGDFYVDTDFYEIYGPKTGSGTSGWGAPTSLVGSQGAQGAQGNPWTAGGTLPTGSSESGAWSFIGPANAADYDPIFGAFASSISFGIPLAAPLDGSHVAMVNCPGACVSVPHCSAPPPNGPGGTVGNPKADSGYLCVYQGGVATGLANPGILIPDLSNFGAGVSGALILYFTVTGTTPKHANGSWAVTG